MIWLGASAALVVILIVGAAAFAAQFRRGAASPEAALEGFAAALASEDLLGALLLLPPDEVDWVRSAWEGAPSGASDVDITGMQVTVDFGALRPAIDGVQFAPIDRIAVELRPDAPDNVLTEALREVPPQDRVVDLRAEGELIEVMVVERDGRWFLSPLGTVLEALSREFGLGGATTPTARRGADSEQAALEGFLAAASRGDFVGMLDHLDPTELIAFDLYQPLMRELSGDPTFTGDQVQVRAQATTDGAVLVVNRIDIEDRWGRYSFDLRNLCYEEDDGRLYRECLDDVLAGGDLRDSLYEEQVEPWLVPAVEAMLDPAPPELRVATTSRDGRVFLSLGGTLEETLLPIYDRLDEHTLAGLVAPQLSPTLTTFEGQLGDSITVSLEENWAAITIPARYGWGATVCPPQGVSRWDWEVAGDRVVTDDNAGVGDSRVVVVGVISRSQVDQLTVRIDEFGRC